LGWHPVTPKRCQHGTEEIKMNSGEQIKNPARLRIVKRRAGCVFSVRINALYINWMQFLHKKCSL